MSRSKGRSSNSVSLFPFLAVLVCAMGALIFLLLVTTRRIRHNAVLNAISVAVAPAATPVVIPVDVPVHEPDIEPPEMIVPEPSAVMAPVPEVIPEPQPDPNAKLQELIAALTKQREEERRRYDEGRKLVTAAKARVAEADGQWNRLAQRLRQKQEERLTVSVKRQVARAALTRLGEEIDTSVVALRRAEQENATESTKYTVVAFDGQSGTTRRPILVECTKNGLTFMQEGITLTAADIDGFTVQYNPLLAGTRTLMSYWRSRDNLDEESKTIGPPYVLLIVRPGGAIAYYAARNMLAEMADDTGYELVNAGQEINVPPSDEEAAAACRRAIDTVLDTREKVIDSIAAARRGGDGVLRFKRGADGFEPVEEERSIFDRTGKPGFGERDHGSPDGGNQPGGGREWSGGKPRSTGDSGFEDSRRTGNDGPQGTSNWPDRNGSTGNDGAGGRPRDPRYDGTGQFPDGSVAGSRMIDDGSGGRFAEGAERYPFDGSGDSNGGEEREGNGGNGTSAVSDPTVDRFPPLNSGTDGPGGDRREGSGTAGNPGSATSGMNSSDGTTGGTSGGPESATGGQTSGGGTIGADSPGQLPAIPLRTFGRQNGQRQPGGSRGSRSGQRTWGIGGARNGIGFERETTITITPSRIQVGTQPQIEVARFKSYDQLREHVLDDLDRHARTWGAPPENFHWVPVVRFKVSPGGNLHYERLHEPLRKLGIGSTVEYPLDSPVYETGPE